MSPRHTKGRCWEKASQHLELQVFALSCRCPAPQRREKERKSRVAANRPSVHGTTRHDAQPPPRIHRIVPAPQGGRSCYAKSRRRGSTQDGRRSRCCRHYLSLRGGPRQVDHRSQWWARFWSSRWRSGTRRTPIPCPTAAHLLVYVTVCFLLLLSKVQTHFPEERCSICVMYIFAPIMTSLSPAARR